MTRIGDERNASNSPKGSQSSMYLPYPASPEWNATETLASASRAQNGSKILSPGERVPPVGSIAGEVRMTTTFTPLAMAQSASFTAH